MKTEIIRIKGDWQEVASDCRATVGKAALDKEPSAAFRRRILIAEHSPIRSMSVKWRWPSIKSWIATHWSRHKWECFIKTQRTDRTGIPRDDLPQSAEVSFTGEANTQHLIDTMRRRLCYQAASETREYAEDLKNAIAEREPDIARVLVPNCVYRAGCPEFETCGLWKRFVLDTIRNELKDARCVSIEERYELYDKWSRKGAQA